MTRTRKSAPTLTVQQRRHEIIDLLADHLARMSPPPPRKVSAPTLGERQRRGQIIDLLAATYVAELSGPAEFR